MLAFAVIVFLLVQVRQVIQLLRDCVQAVNQLVTALKELVDTIRKFFRR